MLKPKTPSGMAFPAFALCPPFYASSDIANNIWMEEIHEPIDQDKMMSQWFDFYQVLAANSLVYLIPHKEGLQDQTYVNCAVYLPHIKDRDIILLSTFTAEGRAGEEVVAGEFFEKLGYDVYKCPYRFEGEPELKWIKDNVYLGGYGIRTEKKALDWIEKTFNCKIIKIREQDEYLYHLDCSVFVLNKDNIMAFTRDWSKAIRTEVEKYVTIHEVSEDAAYMGICNSVRVGNLVLNASSIEFMKSTDKWYDEELVKNKELEKIAHSLGYEVMYFDQSEAIKGGALLSCFVMHLNHKNKLY